MILHESPVLGTSQLNNLNFALALKFYSRHLFVWQSDFAYMHTVFTP